MARANKHIVWLDRHRPMPDWLVQYFNPDYKPDWKHSRPHVRYYKHIWICTPLWSKREDVAAVYEEAYQLRQLGHRVEVDHIVPLRHPLVCGLHCAANLQVLSLEANQHKSNDFWPDMPEVQQDLFYDEKMEHYR